MRFFRLMVFANFIFSLGFAQAPMEVSPSYTTFKTSTAPTIDGKIEKEFGERQSGQKHLPTF